MKADATSHEVEVRRVCLAGRAYAVARKSHQKVTKDPGCSQRERCTTSKYRRVGRWERENCIDAMETRLDRQPERMRVRRSTAEHPFATLKYRMGYTHFNMKRVEHVGTEMGLHVLAYNLTRVMNIIGVQKLNRGDLICQTV